MMDIDQFMLSDLLPSPNAYDAVQSASVKLLSLLSVKEIRSVLPALVRSALCTPLDRSKQFKRFQREVQKKISSIEAVNGIVSLLTVNFNNVQEDALKEQHLRQKLGAIKFHDTILSDSLKRGLLLELEESDPITRMRLVIGEVLRISSQVNEQPYTFKLDDSELFEAVVYIEEISDIIAIAFAEIPSLLPVHEVSEALLRVKYGPVLLCRLVANCPDCFSIVCSTILANAQSTDESDVENVIRVKTLKMLCMMNPGYTKILRAECVSRCKMTGLAIDLSITITEEKYSDLIPFFTGLLLASETKVKDWITEFVKAAHKEHKDNALTNLKKLLVRDMQSVIASFAGRSGSRVGLTNPIGEGDSDADAMHGIAIMRLYCSLKSIFGFKLLPEESELLLDLVTCHPPRSPVGMRFAVVSICTVVSCAFIISSSEREERVIKWLQYLIQESSSFESQADAGSSFGETLLLIAIHFHGHTFEPIIDLVCSTLGIKLRPSSLTKLKILFSQVVFPEKIVAEHALTVPVTKNLNGTIKGFLPIHCIHQLFKSRAFTKHSLEVKGWIFKQICACVAPVHPVMIPLIDTFVRSILVPINISRSSKQLRMSSVDAFSEEDVLSVFVSDQASVACRTTSQLLFMLYALLYMDVLLGNLKDLLKTEGAQVPKEYSQKLYSAIPMKQLLLKCRADEASYGDLYPPLLRLLVTHYPHLCLVEDWIEEEELTDAKLNRSSPDKGNMLLYASPKVGLCSCEELENLLQKISLHVPRAIMLLSKLTMLDADDLIQYAEVVVNSLPVLLDESLPRKLRSLVCQLWMKLNATIPTKLWLMTVNSLREKPLDVPTWNSVAPYTNEEIEKDPLIVLRCDRRVFRSPPIFDIVIRVLNAYIAASRALLSHHLLSNPLIAANKAQPVLVAAELEREELRIALIAAQESAAAQILLEVCLPTEMEKKSRSLQFANTLREIQCRVCCYLHQTFISEPKMAKLIHFQGYPAELLDVTVKGIPSMHICIDFIPELLNQPQLEKQLFAVQLLSHLAIEYPIPKSMAMCLYTLERLRLLVSALPAFRREEFFLPVMPCLTRMCQAFPPLREEVSEMLVRLGRVASSHLNKSFVADPSDTYGETCNPSNSGTDEDMEVEVAETSGDKQIRAAGTLETPDAGNFASFVDLGSDVQINHKFVHHVQRTFQEVSCLSFGDKFALM